MWTDGLQPGCMRGGGGGGRSLLVSPPAQAQTFAQVLTLEFSLSASERCPLLHCHFSSLFTCQTPTSNGVTFLKASAPHWNSQMQDVMLLIDGLKEFTSGFQMLNLECAYKNTHIKKHVQTYMQKINISLKPIFRLIFFLLIYKSYLIFAQNRSFLSQSLKL